MVNILPIAQKLLSDDTLAWLLVWGSGVISGIFGLFFAGWLLICYFDKCAEKDRNKPFDPRNS